MEGYLYDLLQENVDHAMKFRCFRHDLANHVYVIKTYMEMGMVEKSLNYMNKLIDFTGEFEFHSITGNTDLDVILNNKISKIKAIGVETDIVAKLPETIGINIFDITILLGNILDNAYEALLFATEKRLSLDIYIVDNNLYICVINTHNNTILKSGEDILSSKITDSEEHGLGIKSVKCIANKYNGSVDINYDDHEFSIEISLGL